MPTPSETAPGTAWRAVSAHPPRSVFGNYAPSTPVGETPALTASADLGLTDTAEAASARCFVYRFLARAYEDPEPAHWAWLCAAPTHQALRAACAAATGGAAPVAASLEVLLGTLTKNAFDLFHAGYLAAFGHAARGPCPMNEIEYGEPRADPLMQPHQLADLAAFYRAFGLELADDASERHDHVCLELEFMSVLAAKEGYARAQNLALETRRLCLEAQRKFLREHLGRWISAFTRRLSQSVGEGPLAAVAGFTRAIVAWDCARLNVPLGSEDLLLRPVDEAAESLCASCSLKENEP